MSENWNKSYNRINWKNYPSEDTPINETNLNLMDSSLNVVDNRVLALDTIKLDLDVANTMVKDITLNDTTGVITITFLNGTTRTYDTLLEKVAVNFDYDDDPTSAHYQSLVIELDDGTYKYIDLSSLITQYEFTDTDTIDFSVNNDGEISAIVKDGSITGSKLQPNYLADIQAVGQQASVDATTSKSYAVGGTSSRQGEDTDNSKYYKEQAQIAASASLRPHGTITFSQLPNNPQANDMYKISDDFTTDNRFEEPGKDVKGGTFIYYNGTKWVLFASSGGDTHIIGTRAECIAWAAQGLIPDGSVCIFTDDMDASAPYVVGTQARINQMLSDGLLKDGTVCVITDDYSDVLNAASHISYDNTTSGRTETNVQDAIDGINSEFNRRSFTKLVGVQTLYGASVRQNGWILNFSGMDTKGKSFLVGFDASGVYCYYDDQLLYVIHPQ